MPKRRNFLGENPSQRNACRYRVAMTANVQVLHIGYAEDRVASTVTLIRDGEAVIVVDPGMVADRSAILKPLGAAGVEPESVTDVVISHHHPDHTVNIALFANARVHDFMATYEGDVWTDHDDDFAVSDSVRLLSTPGHTDQDVTTIVETAEGLVVLTHLWWAAAGPAEDPFAADRDVLRASRQRVLALNPHLVIPGHGPAFTPDATTPV
jgi:glyoxylase-like metal-dependent hydrolase (beta-lactamase superfamily II)